MQEQHNEEYLLQQIRQELRINALKMWIRNHKLTIEALKQFTEVIPSAIQITADALGLTVDELKKQIEEGQIKQKDKRFSNLDELLEYWDSKYTEDEMTQTVKDLEK